MRTWRTHFLPNLAGPLSQDTALRLGDLVLAEATLSYLGLGIPPDIPTWGAMVAAGPPGDDRRLVVGDASRGSPSPRWSSHSP